MLRAEIKIYAVIEHYADFDEMAENIKLFTEYPDALKCYQETLAKERENGLLHKWGESGVIDEGDDYIAAQDPTRPHDYTGHHYKLYVTDEAPLYIGNLKKVLSVLKMEANGTDAAFVFYNPMSR